MKKNDSVKCGGFVVLSPSAAMEVSGGQLSKVIAIAEAICDFFADIVDFASGFARGFQRGYQDYCK